MPTTRMIYSCASLENRLLLGFRWWWISRCRYLSGFRRRILCLYHFCGVICIIIFFSHNYFPPFVLGGFGLNDLGI